MKPSNENIAAFQVLYKKRFGKDISKEDALEQGTKLLRLMASIYKPMTQAQFDAVQVRRKELLQDSPSPESTT